LQKVLTVERQVIGWFQVLDEGCCRKESFPVGVIEGGVGAFYQFPVFEEPGMKIGKFDHLHERVDNPAKLRRQITKADEQVALPYSLPSPPKLPNPLNPTMGPRNCREGYSWQI
jgi:sarcosine oxidase